MCAGPCGCMLTHSCPGATCARAVVPQVQADAGGPVPGMLSSASGHYSQSSLWVGQGGRKDADKWREGDRWEISREREKEIGEREATGFQNICAVSMHDSVAIGDQSQFKPTEASKNSKYSCQ